MNIFVYSDESGVFDFIHNDIFVFGGIIFLSKNDKDNNERKFIHAENLLRISNNYRSEEELKACRITLTRCQKEVTHLYRWVMNFGKDSENLFDN